MCTLTNTAPTTQSGSLCVRHNHSSWWHPSIYEMTCQATHAMSAVHRPLTLLRMLLSRCLHVLFTGVEHHSLGLLALMLSIQVSMRPTDNAFQLSKVHKDLQSGCIGFQNHMPSDNRGNCTSPSRELRHTQYWTTQHPEPSGCMMLCKQHSTSALHLAHQTPQHLATTRSSQRLTHRQHKSCHVCAFRV